MAGPNSTITITLEVLTEQANAKINSFFSGLNAKAVTARASVAASATQSATTVASGIEKTAEQTTAHIAGLSYYARSAIDSIRLAAAGGGARAGFYAIDEAIRGVLSSGIALSKLVPVLGLVSLAASAGALVWGEWTSATRAGEKAANDLQKELKGVADIMDAIQKRQQAGLLAQSTADELKKYLSGEIPLYAERTSSDPRNMTRGGITRSPTTFQTVLETQVAPKTSPNDPTAEIQVRTQKEVANFKATADEIQKYVTGILDVQGKITPMQVEAIIKLRDMEKEVHAQSLTDLDQEKLAIQKKYEEQRRGIELNLAESRKLMTPKQISEAEDAIAQSKANESIEIGEKIAVKREEAINKINQESVIARTEFTRAANERLDKDLEYSAAKQGKTREEIFQEEYDKRIALLSLLKITGFMSEQQYTDAVRDAQIKRLQGYKAEQDELRRLSALKEQASQKDYDFQKRKIEQNPFLTPDQKNQQLSGLVASQISDVSGQLAQNLAAKPSDTQEQIQQLEQRRELQQQLNGLLLEQSKLLDQAGFINNLKSAWTSYYDQVADTSKDLATFMVSPFKGLSDGIASSLQTIIEKGGSLKTFFVGIGQSIEQAMIQSFSKLVADFITKEAMMLAAHVAGESSQTGATAAGGAARGALRLGETVYHGLLVVLRTGTHILGEIAMTAVTKAETLIRRAAAFLEAQPYIFLAAVKAASSVADIPYVGPFLAPIAAATTFAALEAMAVFRKGGFTGDGSPDEVAGLVHRGEFVIPADRVRQYGLGFFQSLHSGQFAAASAGSLSVRGDTQPGPGGSVIQHKTELSLATFGGEADAKRWAQSEEGDTWFLDMCNKHIYKFQR